VLFTVSLCAPSLVIDGLGVTEFAELAAAVFAEVAADGLAELAAGAGVKGSGALLVEDAAVLGAAEGTLPVDG
jgi:hypothetical protein